MNKMKEEWIGFELLYISLVYIIYYILNKKKKERVSFMYNQINYSYLSYQYQSVKSIT